MSNKMSSIEACRIASMRELNDQLTQINSVLDIEKTYNGELIDMRKMFEVNYWCACPIDGMQKNQLELLKKELEELKKLVAEHVNRLFRRLNTVVLGGVCCRVAGGTKRSLWWRDLVGLGVLRGVEGDWTHQAFIKKLGSGGATRFWLDRWVGVRPLCDVFPCLFKIYLQPDLLIRDVGVWEADRWYWRLKWRRTFFNWEEELFKDLLRVIDVVLISKEEDSWSHVNGGIYSASSNYSFLYQKFHSSSLSLGLAPIRVIAKVWESWAS
ncbi:unnamed protein product [Trifolium pratense]|uniref:Uncharacterized protein n=1 Tax=Trifolium pratense TaxID=57577 RepID=A0ACB0KWN0_TRIPR|nr:unnamed protein product [Trifolium pratense]